MASLQVRRRCLALLERVWARNGKLTEVQGLGSHVPTILRSAHLAKDLSKSTPAVLDRFSVRGFATMASADSAGEQVQAEPLVGRQYPPIGQSFKEEAPFEEGNLTLETGKLARLADAAVVVGFQETKVLCTAIASRFMEPGQSFLPLTVDYREKDYAQGRIPGGYFRREGAPGSRELLCSRLIDRAMRPLFPEGFFSETQLLANVLSLDGSQDPDVLAINGASAALTISDIPWNGPVGAVRIARIDGKFVVNPGLEERKGTDLSLVYAGTANHCVMMDVQAKEITNKDLAQAMRLAHQEAQKLLDAQQRLAQKVNHRKRERNLDAIDESLVERIREHSGDKISAIMEDPSYGKQARGKALAEVENGVRSYFEEAGDTEAALKVPQTFDELKWRIIRRNIIDRGVRPDHRPLDQVRELYCEADFLPALHGSSLFSRGNTQVVCTVTLGSELDAQKLDTLGAPPTKRFMLHYSFPPYATNEVKRTGAVNRREVGHGMLAEKALAAVMPDEDTFPYTVRVTSECTASDGSSSMATVCGGSLALMDAGVPISKHVAAVSIGLFTDMDEDNNVQNYRLVTDIVGLEDHLGDMDYKVAGTRDGVTAIQLDMKLPGIPLDILIEGLDRAEEARCKVIDAMEKEIKAPRANPKDSHPKFGVVPIDKAAAGKVIGPLGATIKGIQAESGAKLKVDDSGQVYIFARDSASFDLARHLIEMAVGKEIETGKIYEGIVTSVRDYGALVELDGTGGQEGLLHISEISEKPIKRVEDVIREGDRVRVLCTGRNLRGDTRLSMKALNRAGSLDSTSSEASSPGSDSDASSSYSGEGVRRAYGVQESAPKRRITEESVEVGKTYKAQVVSIKDFGAFLELETGETGLLHVSQVAHGFVDSITDHVSLGQEVEVAVIKNENGLAFSRLPLLRKPPRRTSTFPIVIPGRRSTK